MRRRLRTGSSCLPTLRRALSAALLASPLLLAACAGGGSAVPTAAATLAADAAMNPLAERYVRLVLALGQRDEGYVDAYYGPPAWRDEAERAAAALPAIERDVAALVQDLRALQVPSQPLLRARQRYLMAQAEALLTRVQLLQGAQLGFDEEARRLYGVTPPRYVEADFDRTLAQLDKLLPGEGALDERYNRFISRFDIPEPQLEALMRHAIDAARTRTAAHIALPDGERFDFAKASGQPWTAYNWYQGNYHSRIELNTDLPVQPRGIIGLAAHEGYPGHHVYNALLEQRLVRGRGWIEYTVYPLYSPQSLIAEGSADLGAGLAFGGGDYLRFEHELIRRAGLPIDEADRYDQVLDLVYQLRGAPIEVARRYLDGQLTREQAQIWLQRYGLLSAARADQRLRFIERYRSYIINYSYGQELVRGWLLRSLAAQFSEAARWRRFETLLGEPHTPADLLD